VAVAIVDSLIYSEIVGIWVNGKRRWLINRLDAGELKRRVVVLVGLEIVIE
jgi:hypothetical protein